MLIQRIAWYLQDLNGEFRTATAIPKETATWSVTRTSRAPNLWD